MILEEYIAHTSRHDMNRIDRAYLADYFMALDTFLDSPSTVDELLRWKEDAALLATTYLFHPAEQRYVDRVLERIKPEEPKVDADADAEEQRMQILLGRKQTEQRTPEWYRQMGEMISASELGGLYSTAYARGKLVMAKTQPYEPRTQSLAVSSERMSPFDWGIRFEPVVKLIYEFRYSATIKELGRMHHPTEPRCAASPDGLVYTVADPEHQAKRGRLIEIKCPVTRKIDGTIPKDYALQMQMQLHVTGQSACDYVEAVFASPYNAPVETARYAQIGPGRYTGWIAVIYSFETGLYRYEYSPVNVSQEQWTPPCSDREMKMEDGDGSMGRVEQVIEIVPWRLFQWNEQRVARSEEWWAEFQPMIREFWQDVERAKRGEFVPPESTRASKKPKTTEARGASKCLFTFHKEDEATAAATATATAAEDDHKV